MEFYLNLEGKGDEFGSGHCLLPQQIRPVIEAFRPCEQSDGLRPLTCVPLKPFFQVGNFFS